MTTKREREIRKLRKKTGMSHQAAHNLLTTKTPSSPIEETVLLPIQEDVLSYIQTPLLWEPSLRSLAELEATYVKWSQTGLAVRKLADLQLLRVGLECGDDRVWVPSVWFGRPAVLDMVSKILLLKDNNFRTVDVLECLLEDRVHDKEPPAYEFASLGQLRTLFYVSESGRDIAKTTTIKGRFNVPLIPYENDGQLRNLLEQMLVNFCFNQRVFTREQSIPGDPDCVIFFKESLQEVRKDSRFDSMALVPINRDLNGRAIVTNKLSLGILIRSAYSREANILLNHQERAWVLSLGI